jgi:uncharacterized membrane protein YqjE
MADWGERSIATVLKDIVGNIQELVRAEIRLAKAEVRQEVDKARRSIALLVFGGVVTVLALAFLMLASVYALSIVVAPWMAALITAVVAGVIGWVFVAAGLTQMRHVTFVPPKIVTTIEESVPWAKTANK